jgi:UDP-N-acetylglucosamine 2-epimerase
MVGAPGAIETAPGGSGARGAEDDRPVDLLLVLGTRPEAIKLAPVILAARERSAAFTVRVCATGQHREMVAPFLDLFGIAADDDLAVMRPGQGLSGLVARVLEGLDALLVRNRPDWVVVQGDTSTAMAAALAAFHRGVPVAHVEAGLRTWNLQAPFPEELNRQVIGRIAALHLAPTAWAAQNLRREGVAEARIVVTGNTVIDALRAVRAQHLRPGEMEREFACLRHHRLLLVTGHRRESFGRGFEELCQAIATALERWPDLCVIYPVHLNPRVREPVQRILGPAVAGGRLVLAEPADYRTFVGLLDAAWVVLTDSGGVQEEAPGLGKPVLCTRETTERPEGVEAGVVRLVGTTAERILAALEDLHDCPGAYEAMARQVNPYGDGHAAPRILEAMLAASARAGRESG